MRKTAEQVTYVYDTAQERDDHRKEMESDGWKLKDAGYTEYHEEMYYLSFKKYL